MNFENEITPAEALLIHLRDAYPRIIIIGGWATWLYTKSDKSHGVDFIAPYETLASLKAHEEMTLSTHLGGRKYRLASGKEHADIYVPYESQLGNRLKLKVELLIQETTSIDGFETLRLEPLLAAKFAGLLDRADKIPGIKDRKDILALLFGETYLDITRLSKILTQASAVKGGELPGLIEEVFKNLGEAPGLGREKRAKLRTWGKEISRSVGVEKEL